MKKDNDETEAFFEHLRSIDTLKLAIMCAFQEGFETSFYHSTLDEQKKTASGFVPAGFVELLKDIENLTTDNANAFFREFFKTEVFRQEFAKYFELRYPAIMEKAKRNSDIQNVQRFLKCGVTVEKIAEITKLTSAEVAALQSN